MMNLELEHAEGECPAQPRAVSHGGSKVTRERVGLLVLGVLLAAAAIVIYRLSFNNMQTKRELHTLRENLTKTSSCSLQRPEAAGWEAFRDKCYHFSSIPLSWQESRRLCRYHRADLVKIDRFDEQKFLGERLKEKMADAEDKFWIGLTDSQTEGTWLWVDGSQLDRGLVFWSRSEPDNWNGSDPRGEDCVRMGEKVGAEDEKLWFDSYCEKRHRFICERKEEGGKCV